MFTKVGRWVVYQVQVLGINKKKKKKGKGRRLRECFVPV